ncbi:hypothetical protein RIF29_18191 [Crotalaria pallida]|uniref:La-related protein 6B n=1 Tax=Crotalaria pallida TaxID=3830 RepID=A0AAN9IF93_CROPI
MKARPQVTDVMNKIGICRRNTVDQGSLILFSGCESHSPAAAAGAITGKKEKKRKEKKREEESDHRLLRIEIEMALSSSSDTNTDPSPSLSRNLSLSRLNAEAPEFVPSPRPNLPPPTPTPNPNMLHLYHQPIQRLLHNQHRHHHHHNHYNHLSSHNHHQQQRQYYDSASVIHPRQVHHHSDHHSKPTPPSKISSSSDDSSSSSSSSSSSNLKLLNQVEYYFSDLNLATTDHLMRFINKDPEGFVPISVVASFKKIKALITSHSQLATLLRSSSKLVVSEDGKKVKRQSPLTESDIEELQSRIVIAENLPDDHCHQNLMKVFSTVGSVKTIRTCPPQTSNSGTSSASRSGKADGMPLSSKLHAFVEYESVELAEKAVAELNDEGNWRSGLRVRLMLRRVSKQAQGRGKKGPDVEINGEEDYTCVPEQQQSNEKQIEDASFPDTQLHEHVGEEQGYEKENNGQKKGRNRGRAKGRGRALHSHQNNNRVNHHHHHIHLGTPTAAPLTSSNNSTPPGPRMPDGTRGFSMGRGKPTVAAAVTNNIA